MKKILREALSYIIALFVVEYCVLRECAISAFGRGSPSCAPACFFTCKLQVATCTLLCFKTRRRECFTFAATRKIAASSARAKRNLLSLRQTVFAQTLLN